MFKFKYLLFALSLLFVQACSSLQFPGVYKIDVEQGNIITQEMVDQLKPGMSREQVEYILGSPLIRDTFNNDRWDYLYKMRKGSGKIDQYRLSVFFDGDKLKRYRGDFTGDESSTVNDKDSES